MFLEKKGYKKYALDRRPLANRRYEAIARRPGQTLQDFFATENVVLVAIFSQESFLFPGLLHVAARAVGLGPRMIRRLMSGRGRCSMSHQRSYRPRDALESQCRS